jgi:hypothetical protein
MFPHAKKISPQIIRNLGNRPQNLSPALSQDEKNLKDICFKGRQIINLPRAATYIGPALGIY